MPCSFHRVCLWNGRWNSVLVSWWKILLIVSHLISFLTIFYFEMHRKINPRFSNKRIAHPSDTCFPTCIWNLQNLQNSRHPHVSKNSAYCYWLPPFNYNGHKTFSVFSCLREQAPLCYLACPLSASCMQTNLQTFQEWRSHRCAFFSSFFFFLIWQSADINSDRFSPR